MKRYAALLAMILAAGCYTRNINPNLPPGQFERDEYICMQEAQQPRADVYSAEIQTNWSLYYGCMRAHGWR